MTRRSSLAARIAPFLGAALHAAVLAACGTPCGDVDGDGYGDHCALGPDCDDTNPARNVDCVGVPPPDCVAAPLAPGCPCVFGQVRDCYSGAPATEDVGPCRGGRTLCLTGTYGLCLGEEVPGVESCNGLDDDCDGRSDEGVSSPCGGCDPSCEGALYGPLGTPFTAGGGLAVTARGQLTIARTTIAFDGVFVANTAEDTLSHVSATSVTELGRHPAGGDEPTRVAVDHRGDVFVTSRAPLGQGVLAKLTTDPARCVDRDASGTIRTSTGPSDVPSLAEDECVLFAVPIGSVGEGPRALLVDGSYEPGGGGGGDAWVGLHDGESIVHVDGETGTVLERLATPGFRPYAAAADDRGMLYFASQDGKITSVDRRSAPPTLRTVPLNLACYATYGIGVAADDAILGAGFACNQLFRFDARSGWVFRSAIRANPRGVAVAGGVAYVSHTDGYLSVVDPTTASTLASIDLFAMGLEPIEGTAVGIDALGAVWVVSGQTTQGGAGVLTRVDPSTRAVTHQLRVGLGPHMLGDPTGQSLRGAFGPGGTTQASFPGCTNGVDTRWERLFVEAATSPGGAIEIEYRSASTLPALASAPFSVLVADASEGRSIVSLAGLVPDGFVVELRVTLTTSTRDAAPLVRSIGLEYDCTVIIE